jgi:hypothetical protein
MRGMEHTEPPTAAGAPSSAESTPDTEPIESQMLPGIGFGWPYWLYCRLRALFKRATPTHGSR